MADVIDVMGSGPAGILLGEAIVATLLKKGVLTAADADEIYARALRSLTSNPDLADAASSLRAVINAPRS